MIILAFALASIGSSIVAVLIVFANRRRLDNLEQQTRRLTEEFEKRDRLFEGEFEKRRVSEARLERAIDALGQMLKNNTELLHVVVRGHMKDAQ